MIYIGAFIAVTNPRDRKLGTSLRRIKNFFRRAHSKDDSVTEKNGEEEPLLPPYVPLSGDTFSLLKTTSGSQMHS
jgi:hypothetical protein